MNKRQVANYTTILDKFMEETGADRIEAMEFLDRMHRYESTLHRLDENACNGWPRMTTEVREGKTYRFAVEDLKWKARDEKKEASIHKLIEKAVKAYPSITVDYNGDPRGGAIKLTFTRTKWYNCLDKTVVLDW